MRTYTEEVRRWIALAFIVVFLPTWAFWTWLGIDITARIILNFLGLSDERSKNTWTSVFIWFVFGLLLLVGVNALEEYMK